MNKKQVGAFLKVVGKDTRPTLTNVVVDVYEGTLYMVATDGYKLAAVKLDDDAAELEGRMIRRDALERWYKLATGKSRLTGAELVGVSNEDYGRHGSYPEGKYPIWQQLIPEPYRNPSRLIAFNATYMKELQDVDGSDGMVWNIGGELEAVFCKNERGIYVFMPMKQ